MLGNGNRREEVKETVNSSGWLVCWFVKTGDIFSVDSQQSVATISPDRVDALENISLISVFLCHPDHQLLMTLMLSP